MSMAAKYTEWRSKHQHRSRYHKWEPKECGVTLISAEQSYDGVLFLHMAYIRASTDAKEMELIFEPEEFAVFVEQVNDIYRRLKEKTKE